MLQPYRVMTLRGCDAVAGSTNQRCEFALEGRDLRALRHPADSTAARAASASSSPSSGSAIGIMTPPPLVWRAVLERSAFGSPPFDQIGKSLFERNVARKPSRRSAFPVEARRRGTGLTDRSGANSGVRPR